MSATAAIDQPLLLEVQEQLSPRLAWLKKHNIRSMCLGADNPVCDYTWLAWQGDKMPFDGDDACAWAGGDTEEEAIFQLASQALGIPMWNEEPFIAQRGGVR